MITLYLIRHGETEWNKSGRYQGSTDVALSDMGLQQAQKTTEYFRQIPLDGVIPVLSSGPKSPLKALPRPTSWIWNWFLLCRSFALGTGKGRHLEKSIPFGRA